MFHLAWGNFFTQFSCRQRSMSDTLQTLSWPVGLYCFPVKGWRHHPSYVMIMHLFPFLPGRPSEKGLGQKAVLKCCTLLHWPTIGLSFGHLHFINGRNQVWYNSCSSPHWPWILQLGMAWHSFGNSLKDTCFVQLIYENNEEKRDGLSKKEQSDVWWYCNYL